MLVIDLIHILAAQDPHSLVLLSSDSEGNELNDLYGLEAGSFKDGKFGLKELTDDLENLGYTEADVVNGQDVVVLFPE